MNDHSSLLLLNQLCDSFETFDGGSDESEDSETYDAATFLDKLKGDRQTPPMTEAFVKSLTVELMAIELQRPPFPSETTLREKYPQFDNEITSAARLAQENSAGTPAEFASMHYSGAPDKLKLPIEERFERTLNSQEPPTSESRTFGRYQLIERLGAGGFGIVYRAHDPLMHRDVAIKLPRTSLINEPSDRTRFEREMTALSRLNHPNIVTAYHAEEVDGYFCLISEYLEGGNLEDWLAQPGNRPSAETAVAIVLQLCDALNHAHELGIVHCDIKPSNIMIGNGSDNDPLIKLTDFGLARVLKDGSAATSTGLAIGTLQYMSPEQLTRSSKVASTTDIYSVGIVLYRLLAGKHPFETENEIELFSQIIERQPDGLQTSRFNVPTNLAAIVSKCLMKRPADRYPSARELQSDLEGFARGKLVAAKPLGFLGQTSHWLKSKQRLREAGAYSLALNVVIGAWSLFSLPIYYVTGIMEQLGIDRMFEYLMTVITLLIILCLPPIWAALRTIELKSRGIWVGLIFSCGATIMMALQLFNIYQLDFGGIYRNETTRVVVFALLVILFGLQTILYGIALYANQYQKQFSTVNGKLGPR